jgi:hypothetical protein
VFLDRQIAPGGHRASVIGETVRHACHDPFPAFPLY